MSAMIKRHCGHHEPLELDEFNEWRDTRNRVTDPKSDVCSSCLDGLPVDPEHQEQGAWGAIVAGALLEERLASGQWRVK